MTNESDTTSGMSSPPEMRDDGSVQDGVETMSESSGLINAPWDLNGWILFTLVFLVNVPTILSQSGTPARLLGTVIGTVFAAFVVTFFGTWIASGIKSRFTNTDRKPSDGGFQNVYWRPHFAVVLFWLLFGLLTIGNAINSVIPGIAEVFRLVLVIPILVVGTYGVVGSVYACYYDASDLRQSDLEYFPLWGAWVIGHLILTPLVAAPLYLLYRYRKTGTPTLDEMRSAILFWRSTNSAGTAAMAD